VQVQIPGEYRQATRWLLNLDAASFAILVGSAALGFAVVKSHGALAPRIGEGFGIMAVGAVIALVRWPLDHGDRALTWARRGWDYYWRARKGSAWAEAPPLQKSS